MAPVTVFTSVRPVAVAEKTSSRRVPIVTGMVRPLTAALIVVPMEMAPVREPMLTTAPAIGVNRSEGPVLWYIWAVT